MGLLDDKVSPEESFKWLRLLRKRLTKLKTSEATSLQEKILCHILEESGHEGSSSMMELFHDYAVEITFLESMISFPAPYGRS